MISVLIVEDDPMVAEFNKRYLAEIDGFALAGVVHNVADGMKCIEENEVDLVLLDMYMPGRNGIELLKYIREHGYEADVILITAASDVDKVQAALRLGAVDYLIKPFEFERLQQALVNYREQFQFFNKNKHINQVELDQKILVAEQKTLERSLPKGLTKTTLQSIMLVIKEFGEATFSTDVVADNADISRVSVRKYLKFLTEIGVLEESLTYGIGRPVSQYIYREDTKLKEYL